MVQDEKHHLYSCNEFLRHIDVLRVRGGSSACDVRGSQHQVAFAMSVQSSSELLMVMSIIIEAW